MNKKIKYGATFMLCMYICITSVFSMLNSIKPIGSKVYHGIMAEQSLQTIISVSDTAFKSNIYQKNRLVRIDSMITYMLTKRINSVQVLQGKDNWLFYKSETDGDSLADYMGTNFFTEEDMQKTLQTLVITNEILYKKGIAFALMVAPNKENVYFEYMPNDIKKISQKSRTELLIDYLKQNSDFNIIYPKNALLQVKSEFPLYYKYDTHWNQLGGYVGVQEIMKSWGFSLEELSKKEISQELLQTFSRGDLARMAGLNIFFKDIEYKVEDTKTLDWNAIEKQGNGLIHLNNNNAVYQEKLLLVGDSFRISMLPELTSIFTDVYVVHRNEYKSEMLDEISPDRVIVEYVERYSNKIQNQIVYDD